MPRAMTRPKIGAKRRAPNLSPELVSEILAIIRRLSVRLTWPALIEQIEQVKLITYTRQALAKHALIAEAYEAQWTQATAGETKARKKSASPEIQMVLDEMVSLKASLARAEEENERLLRQFVRWAYNASQRGLTEEFLNQPLPERRTKREHEMHRVK